MTRSDLYPAHIALNRFGYGLRRGEAAPEDTSEAAQRHLLRQLDAFDPAPSAIAGRGDYSDKPGEIIEMLRRLRQERQQQESAQSMQAMEDMGEEALPHDVRQT